MDSNRTVVPLKLQKAVCRVALVILILATPVLAKDTGTQEGIPAKENLSSAFNRASLSRAPLFSGYRLGQSSASRYAPRPGSRFFAANQGAGAASGQEGEAAGEMTEEEKIAEAIANPLSYLWLFFMQNDAV